MDKTKLKKIIYPCVFVLAAVIVGILLVRDAYVSDYEISEKSTVAMGTVLSVKLYGAEDDTQLPTQLTQAVAGLENIISWRADGSAAQKLNRDGTVKSADISYLSSLCLDVYNSSGGVFDVTTGIVSRLWDIGGDNARVPSDSELEAALGYVDGSLMSVSDTDETVTIGSGQAVDFGAVGKGYACDTALEYLKGSSVSGAVISVGGSVLLYGKHNRAGDSWRVAVRNPQGSESDYCGVISLADGGSVSTSGDYERTLTVDGVTYHHILDPKTGRPAESGLSSVTVVTGQGNGALSDALSTACFVLGLEDGMKLLESFSAEGIFIDHDKNVYVTDGLKSGFELTDETFTLAD